MKNKFYSCLDLSIAQMFLLYFVPPTPLPFYFHTQKILFPFNCQLSFCLKHIYISPASLSHSWFYSGQKQTIFKRSNFF